MDELGAGLAAGKREISYSQRVGLVRGKRLFLGDIDLVVSRGVENDLRIGFCNSFFDASRVGDIERVAVEALDSPLAPLEFTAELHAKLAATAENYRFLLHSFCSIAYGVLRNVQESLQIALGVADGSRERGFGEIVGEHAGDVVEIGGCD
jgi:hypothetical protein